MKKTFFFIILYLFLVSSVLSVGIRRFMYDVPRYEFKPGLEATISYELLNPTRNTIVSLSGEFKDYINISKTYFELNDPDKKFNVHIHLPDSPDNFTPGKNIQWLLIKDDLSNLAQSGMIVSAAARSPIVIYVPYPGYFCKISSYSLQNVNKNQNTTLNFELWNRGKKNITDGYFTFRIFKDNKDFFYKQEKNIFIESQTKKQFSVEVHSFDFTPGDYNASLEFFYNNKSVRHNSVFKIGELNINIVNYTKVLNNDSIQKFFLELQSDWNAPIKNVYANININNISASTSPTTLSNFEKKKVYTHIEPFLPPGNYSASVVLFFADKTIKKDLPITIIHKSKKKSIFTTQTIIIALLVVVFLLFIISIFMFIVFIKKANKISDSNSSSKINNNNNQNKNNINNNTNNN